MAYHYFWLRPFLQIFANLPTPLETGTRSQPSLNCWLLLNLTVKFERTLKNGYCIIISTYIQFPWNRWPIFMTGVGKAYENGYAERLMRTIKEEEVDLSDYRNFNEVYNRIEEFLDEVYMKKRIHSSLDCMTPSEFETKWRAE
nr:integrase core domain-containing protein [Leptolyngbya sp. Heron Island J]